MEQEQQKLRDITKGEFGESLKRNNKQIREDRANTIIEDAALSYRRRLEDLCTNYRRTVTKRQNLLDLSPENTLTLKLATDFRPEEFVEIEMEASISLRNLAIQINVGADRYKKLFGQDFDFTSYGVPAISI